MPPPSPPPHSSSSVVPAGCPERSPPRPPITLQPSKKKRPAKASRALRAIRSLFRSFPILNPACRLHAALPRGGRPYEGHIHGATRTTGTLFGHRKGRINLAIQDSPRSIPMLLLELAIHTCRFMQAMSSDHLRIALECEKKAADKTMLLDEPLWIAYINGRKIGYAIKRDPSENDLDIMQLLHTVSVGAGVLPGDMTDPADGEMTYIRAHFDRVAGSKDSETLYMLNPDGNTGPELAIFFVRI
ncbi:protein MIZU-KUSSEI 1-like [Phoenix dactylifera]|uniref:Protein MIZU-KUSSEI 1-like n=1 Tax=Phoenix dactylifera TaxID=42345 RepID=A0A8B7C903_PHODC|nr:protein MIZU-KUSSEI 1-like [Phoenix dactylifera]